MKRFRVAGPDCSDSGYAPCFANAVQAAEYAAAWNAAHPECLVVVFQETVDTKKVRE